MDLLYIDKKDPWSSHSIMQKWLNRFPAGTRVLDIGTATGLLGKRCADLGFFLKGIEPVAEWAEAAKSYYDEMCAPAWSRRQTSFLQNRMW